MTYIQTGTPAFNEITLSFFANEENRTKQEVTWYN